MSAILWRGEEILYFTFFFGLGAVQERKEMFDVEPRFATSIMGYPGLISGGNFKNDIFQVIRTEYRRKYND